ncbi:MaoC family dehydratase [Rhodococcus sp. NPDC079359]|uniref:MaoC family dehydratase n=1 Tax=Rhodococcus sp. NPDC079359 TaxID=3154961 RepID=UPI0034500084
MFSTEPHVPESAPDHHRPGGPFFDDLEVDQRIVSPGVTLTSGLAAAHQCILGDRAALFLDTELASKVTGTSAQLAHPGLVWDVAIGQSTHFSQRAKANLFYRGLALHRFPDIGDTLTTETQVIGLRENTRREGRFPTGMVALRIKTVDQQERTVLDFARCAMIPMSVADTTTAHRQDLSAIGSALDRDQLRALTAQWDLFGHPTGNPVAAGDTFDSAFGDVVTSAPELARLTLNLAAVHHDYRSAGSQRLVYGGHTIGLANAQLSKLFPQLVSVVGWNSCDHLGPVHEGDTVFSSVTIEQAELLPNGSQLVDLRTTVRKVSPEVNTPVDVLDWRVVGVFA